jgi:hypothetical protein
MWPTPRSTQNRREEVLYSGRLEVLERTFIPRSSYNEQIWLARCASHIQTTEQTELDAMLRVTATVAAYIDLVDIDYVLGKESRSIGVPIFHIAITRGSAVGLACRCSLRRPSR